MVDLLAPGDFPAPHIDDKVKDFPGLFAADMWSQLWPKLVPHFANAAERDAELPGLGPADSLLAFIQDRGWLTRWAGTEWRPVHPVGGVGSCIFTAGVGTMTHNLGFVPAGMVITPRLGASVVHVALAATGNGATSIGLRGWTQAGDPLASSISSISYLAIP